MSTTPEFPIRRTLLLTPGHNAARLAKAVALPVDAVVFDLEDGVPPHQKAAARRTVAEALATLEFGGRERMVRVNAVGTPELAEDLPALPLDAIDALLVAKVEDAEQVAALDRLLRDREAAAGRPGPVPLVLSIETPAGLLRAAEIARTSPRAGALFFGSGDYCAQTGGVPAADVLQVPRALIVAAAAAAGLQAIDAAYFQDVKNAEATRADAAAARRYGFAGKLVFHPNQVAVVNEVFTPTAEEVARAEALVAAYQDALDRGDGVAVVGGEFVAIDTVLMMRRVLATARRAADADRARA